MRQLHYLRASEHLLGETKQDSSLCLISKIPKFLSVANQLRSMFSDSFDAAFEQVTKFGRKYCEHK